MDQEMSLQNIQEQNSIFSKNITWILMRHQCKLILLDCDTVVTLHPICVVGAPGKCLSSKNTVEILLNHVLWMNVIQVTIKRFSLLAAFEFSPMVSKLKSPSKKVAVCSPQLIAVDVGSGHVHWLSATMTTVQCGSTTLAANKVAKCIVVVPQQQSINAVMSGILLSISVRV